MSRYNSFSCFVLFCLFSVVSCASVAWPERLLPLPSNDYVWPSALMLAAITCVLVWKITNPTEKKYTIKPGNYTPSSYCQDVLVVGGGCAGATIAAALGKRGYRVLVLERDMSEPERIVGELLQPLGVQLLCDSIGLPETLEGYDAQVVTGYGLFEKKVMTRLDYPNFSNGQKATGRAFHNGRFVMALRNAVRATKTAELRQGTVKKLVYDGARCVGVEYTQKDSDRVLVEKAPITIICDGLFSTLRTAEQLTTNTYNTRSRFMGLILKNVDLPLKQGGHVILADPTPTLAYPISSSEARMLIDFPDDVPTDQQQLENHLLNHLKPQLPDSIQPAFVSAVKERKFKVMPNRQMSARPSHIPGTVLIGDIFNVRHPLTGGGMTCAFADVANLIHIIEDQHMDFNNNKQLDRAVAHHYATRGNKVAAINILADALYDVFGQKYADLRAGCYHYLSMGGEMSNGPLRLLCGVSTSQLLLVSHFFAVAFWSTLVCCFPFPTPSKIIRSWLMIRDACIIILPLLLQEHPGWLFAALGCVIRTVFWFPYQNNVTLADYSH